MIRIPPWVLRIALLLSLPIAGAALFLTRTYAVGNLVVLGLDADTAFVRRLSIDVLLAAHVAAFFLCALLPDSVFRFRRWQLYALAFAIWVFDAGAIYQARFGVMDSAEQSKVTATNRVADMRAALAGLQESARAMRATASRQMANKMITLGAQSQAEAARLEAKAAALAEKLAAMPTGAGTTEVRTWGWLAPYKAATESALISFVSLIMLGLAGLMLRELLQPAVARHAAVKPAPAPAPAKPVAPVAPTAPAPKVSYGSALAGAGLVGVGAAVAPVAHSAPAVPAAPRPAPAAATPVTPTAPAQVQAPAPAHADALAPADAPEQVQVHRQQAKKSASRPVPTGVREAIKSEAIKPSQGGIKSLGHGQDAAAGWLEQLGAEGLIERNPSGKGWRLVKVAA